MKALLCKEHGLPDALVLEEVDAPPLSAGTVRIEVRAAGVNFPDVLIIQGKYQFQPPLPFAPGGEVAGVVAEVGEGVTTVAVGDRVLGLTGWNGFAEQAVVPVEKCFAIPDAMPFDVAAAFGMTYGTVAHALLQRGQVQPGEVLLVHGATGGVGTAAIEIGRCLGASIIATGGRAEKLEVLQREYDLPHVIDISAETPLKEAVKKLTKGRGADVIFDPVGGEVFEQSLRCINWNGRLLVVGFASGTIGVAKANLTLLKGSSVVGVFWGAFTTKEPERNAENFRRLFAWYAEGKLKPRISHRFPLAEGGRAIEALMKREVLGKAVVIVSED
ncbi:MAG: NADPH:quinone oxidoreductase family protein [Myxococcota bacterium]